MYQPFRSMVTCHPSMRRSSATQKDLCPTKANLPGSPEMKNFCVDSVLGAALPTGKKD